MQAITYLKEDTSPQDIQDDWIVNFFEKSRIISDADMQNIWGRILAGEANGPGSFSRQTVNLMVNLDKKDAEFFQRFCGFCWMNLDDGSATPTIFDFSDDFYKTRGITFDQCRHLESLGLIKMTEGGFSLSNDQSEDIHLSYFNKQVSIKPHEKGVLVVGSMLLTRAGNELFRIINAQPVEGFYDFSIRYWTKESINATNLTFLPKKLTQHSLDSE